MSTRKRKPFSQISVAETGPNTSSKRSKTTDDLSDNGYLRRAGTINYIVLKNFMCHSLLEVKFENNVSIIIGKNGSGKSAILTALIVGLGGKACLTNRGTSVKNFVKAGKPSGSIEIDLCNEGPMAYRPSEYGNRINIIRNLSSNGSGAYRIRNENNEIVSTQAKEVQNIISSLNIQVDNPICILNQDTSRNFLSSNDPKNKFALFMKATKLDTLESEYRKTQLNKRDSVRIIEEKEDSFKKLQDEIKRLKKKIDNHKSIISLKDRNTLLHQELQWAKVRDLEVELDQEKINVETVEKKLESCKKNSADKIDKVNALKETLNILQQEIQELKDQIEVQKRPQLDIKSQIDGFLKTCAMKKKDVQQIQTTIQAKNNDIKILEQDIAAANENMSKVEQQKMKRIKDLASFKNKLKGMDEHLETVKNDLFQIKNDLARRQDEEQHLHHELGDINRKLATETQNLSALSAESSNDLLLYGPDMPKLKQLIAQSRNKFQHEPKGPLGSYIKLKDKKWAVAVEGHLGPGLLGAFAVDNNKDNQLLREMFTKVWTRGHQPQVITSKFVFKKHNISKNLVQEPPDCVSLYNAIEIDNPIVSNCIVDNSGPENILLIPNDARAQELLSNQHKVPKNCHQGITMKGDRYYPDPNYRTYASQYHRAHYLQVDTKEYMQQLQQNIDSLKRKRQTVSKQLDAFVKDMQQQEERKTQLEEKVKKVNMARTQIRRQLEELNSSAEPEVQNVQYLEQELEELKNTITEKTATLGKIAEEIKELKVKISAAENKLSSLKDSTKELEVRIQSLRDEIRENQTQQQELSTRSEFDTRHIKQYEVKLVDSRSLMVLKQNALKKLAEEASSVGERLSDLRSVTDITNEMNEIKHTIARIETDSDNVNDVMERYNELSDKVRKTSDIMRSLKEDVSELTIALERRNKHYKLTESYFLTYMKYSFKKILEYRQFKGTIEINMAEKKLDLIVIPQHGSQGLTTTSNLSGGERSFSTVAFLYSLWQCMEFPFYFLDEFDVYMDKLNRSKVTDILLHHAKSKPTLQFVFLTPQDVSFINRDVSILRLEDPKRFNL